MARRELLSPVAAIAIAVAFGLGIALLSFSVLAPDAALASCVLGWTMVAIAAIDARRFMIPDVLSLPAIPIGLLASGHLVDPSSSHLVSLDHVIGVFAGGASLWLVREAYFYLRRREGLGLGDVKLASAAGAWIGWDHLPDVILLAASLALSFVIVLMLVGRKGVAGTTRIAFGSFLAPSIWIVWVFRAYGQGF